MGTCTDPNTFKLLPCTSQMWQLLGSNLIPDSITCRALSALMAECVAPESNKLFTVCEPTLMCIMGRGSLRVWGSFGIVPHDFPMYFGLQRRGPPTIFTGFPGGERTEMLLGRKWQPPLPVHCRRLGWSAVDLVGGVSCVLIGRVG